MAEVLGLGMSHYPGMRIDGVRSGLRQVLQRPDIPDAYKDPASWPGRMIEQLADDDGEAHAADHRQRFTDACRLLRKRLDEFEPDLVVVWGDDQYENFKEDIVPSFCVLAYDDLEVHPYEPEVDLVDTGAAVSEFSVTGARAAPPNPWGEPADTSFLVRGHREAAKYLAGQLIEQGIDTAYAYRPLHHTLAHAFANTVMFLDWDREGFDYPLVPMQVNCYGNRVIVNRGGSYPVASVDLPATELDPPGPSPRRCMEVGAAVATALRASPWRVAVIASSSWSHAFLCPKYWFVHPDVEGDLRLYEALQQGDYDYWRSITNDQVDQSGLQEVRNWWCLVGAMEALGHTSPSYHTFCESYLMNSSKCFAIYEPR